MFCVGYEELLAIGTLMGVERVVAIGLLTERDPETLGKSFMRLWPVDETPCFVGLLQATDDADRELWRDREHSSQG